MKLLVLGSGGLLGSVFVDRCLDRSISVSGTYHSEAPSLDIPLEKYDIQNAEKFRELLKEYQPDVVINCAALTDVDDCESDREAAFGINGTAPGELADICVTHDVRFVHISTDYVFNGEAAEPYEESASTAPIQTYGKSKLSGEQSVLEANRDALLARLSFVYGVRGDTNELVGFPSWVREKLSNGEEVPLFTDQHFTPTRAGQAAETILDLLEEQIEGTYHIASRSCVTPYEFGEEIAKIQGASSELLNESSQSDISRPAERPTYTCLDVSKIEGELSRRQPTLREDLQEIKTKFDV